MASGMTFISNRWVFTGPQSYVVKPASDGSGEFVCWSVNTAGERPVTRGTESRMTEVAEILRDRH